MAAIKKIWPQKSQVKSLTVAGNGTAKHSQRSYELIKENTRSRVQVSPLDYHCSVK